MKGIEVKDNFLYFNDALIAKGGNDNSGLTANGLNLLLSGNIIATCNNSQKGINIRDGVPYWGDNVITDSSEESSEYWNPPKQEASTYKPWNYAELINRYDELMNEAPDYITKHRYEINGEPVYTKNGNYPLYHYELTPESYSKTIVIQAGIHGNEMDAKQQLLKVVEILVRKTNLSDYRVFRNIRNDVRLIIFPCISPYGHDNSSMNIPYDEEFKINLNRNYDFNQQYYLDSPGIGGEYPWEFAEVRHVRDVIQSIGPENIDYFMDWHDGGDVEKHFWITYAVDSSSRLLVDNFVSHLIEKYNVENPIIPNCKDVSTTGISTMWSAKTVGLEGSTVEWIGGIFGYDFEQTQMTMSLDIRGNMLLQAYKLATKGWTINEDLNAAYFHFDYPKAFTKLGMRRDGADSRTIVTDSQIYERWDNLQLKFPQLISKSEKLGTNTTQTQDIYTYTFGSGNNKVLYVGGIMRYSAPHKIDEFAIYTLIEYLCNDYIVNQSQFLQELRRNYTIIVLPCIDNDAGNAEVLRDCGINNMALTYKKWQILDNKCQPTNYALSVCDVPIIKNLIDNNQDLKCIVSGGEILTGYSLNSQDYSTDYETQIVLPKNQINEPSNYVTHLINDRNENAIVEHTIGTTFGDYAFDNYGIPTYFVQLQVSKKWNELSEYHTLSSEDYLYNNYEAGRRFANIVNLFLL